MYPLRIDTNSKSFLPCLIIWNMLLLKCFSIHLVIVENTCSCMLRTQPPFTSKIVSFEYLIWYESMFKVHAYLYLSVTELYSVVLNLKLFTVITVAWETPSCKSTMDLYHRFQKGSYFYTGPDKVSIGLPLRRRDGKSRAELS